MSVIKDDRDQSPGIDKIVMDSSVRPHIANSLHNLYIVNNLHIEQGDNLHNLRAELQFQKM